MKIIRLKDGETGSGYHAVDDDVFDRPIASPEFPAMTLMEAIRADTEDILGWHQYHDILVGLGRVSAQALPEAKVERIKYDPEKGNGSVVADLGDNHVA